MDHPCHRCGATIEEGLPFCPHCGAPQIRVTGPPPDSVPVTPPLPPGTPEEAQSPAQPVPLPAAPVTYINWSQGVPAAALAGLLMAIPTAIPILGAGCCLWIFGAGVLSVLFYTRKRAPIFLTRGMGARLGLLSGFFGFFIYLVLESIKMALFHLGNTMREAMRQAMERSAAQNPDPHAQQVMQWFMSPAGQAFMITFLVAVSFVAFLLLAAAGGALGAALWGRKSATQP